MLCETIFTGEKKKQEGNKFLKQLPNHRLNTDRENPGGLAFALAARRTSHCPPVPERWA